MAVHVREGCKLGVEESVRRIREDVQNMAELRAAYEEGKRLLRQYGALAGASDASLHTTEQLTGALHGAAVEARSRLGAARSTGGRVRAGGLREALLSREMAASPHLQKEGGEAFSPVDVLARDVTDRLAEMQKELAEEVLRSEKSLDMFGGTAGRLLSTAGEHDMLSTALRSTRRLIVALVSRERSDRFMVGVAVGIYALALVYVLSQRLYLVSALCALARRTVGVLFASLIMPLVRHVSFSPPSPPAALTDSPVLGGMGASLSGLTPLEMAVAGRDVFADEWQLHNDRQPSSDEPSAPPSEGEERRDDAMEL